MSHCVPDWDGNGGELDAIIPATDYLPPVKGKWECLPSKSAHLSDLAFVRDHDAVESQWTDDGHITMQGHGGKGSRPQWQVGYVNNWSGSQESEDAVTPSKPLHSSAGKDGTLVVNEPTVDAHVNTSSVEDDEMVSWLQYPLDDSLERNYCSDFFGELPNSNMQFLKDSFASGQSPGARTTRSPGPVTVGNNVSVNKASSADAAMAMGAGRAAGLLPQAGVEAFTKVRTTMPQPYGGKWPPSATPNIGKTLGTLGTPASRSSTITSNLISPLLTSKPQSLSFQPGRAGTMNFSHFSRPAVLMKANLQCLGMSHGVTGTTRLKTPFGGGRTVDASISLGSSIAESTTTRQRSGTSKEDTDVSVEVLEGRQQSLGTGSSWPSMQNPPSPKDADAAGSSAVDLMDSDSKLEKQENCLKSSDTSAQGLEKPLPQRAELQEAPEPTITSSSGGSGNSVDRGKEAASGGKRRTREGEESECQSEVSNLLQSQLGRIVTIAHREGDDELTELKKPQQRGSTTKRSRAAEVHNLSERRRRDRINEKMKALQELIPNSNKTDKASMLDEAIEYLKMLQLQLQMMSMRSGMSIPSMVMPAGMQHLQMPQMGLMPPMGMSLGLGMGMNPLVGMNPMGLGIMDVSAVTPGRPSHMVPPHNMSASSPAVSMVDSHDHRLQGNGVMDPLNVYLARQQQLQLPAQSLNMDVYSAYMLHQQHQQQQHQQQQQQQLQLHHLPGSMGGGAPQ